MALKYAGDAAVPSFDLRRAVDAGRSPWLVALFFVPLVNYALMLVLSALPSRPPAPRPEPGKPVVPTAWAIGLSLLASVGLLPFALEGAICVVMGVPLALPIALAGAVVGLSRSRSSLVACSRT